jgi:hypothetical protein
MTQPSALRFFWVILQPSGVALAALLAVLVFATYLASLSAYGFDEALSVILLAQILIASTGYYDRLVRGHFDSILAGRRRRESLALAHAALSIVPGLVLWLIFGLVDHLMTSRRSMAMTSGGLIAFIYASVVVWAVSLRLGRYTAGVLWVFALFLLAGAGKVQLLRDAYGTSSASWSVTGRATAAAMAFPLMMFGNGGYVEPLVLLGVGIATVAMLGAGIWIVTRLDAPLKDPA